MERSGNLSKALPRKPGFRVCALSYRVANIFLTCLIFFLLTIKLKNNYQPIPFFCYHFFWGHALGSESRVLTTGPPGNSQYISFSFSHSRTFCPFQIIEKILYQMFIYVLICIFYPFFFIFMQTIMQTIFKVFNLLQYCFCFKFWFFFWP